MASLARVNEVCDAVVGRVLAMWAELRESPVTAPHGCERTYLTPVKFDRLVGRHVWVQPVRFSDDNASRAENLGQYALSVVVAERYEDGGPAPRDWLDERVAFVEAVYDLLGSFGNRRASGWLLVGSPERRHFTESGSVEVYDVDYLDKYHTFWAELEFEFREVR